MQEEFEDQNLNSCLLAFLRVFLFSLKREGAQKINNMQSVKRTTLAQFI